MPCPSSYCNQCRCVRSVINAHIHSKLFRKNCWFDQAQSFKNAFANQLSSQSVSERVTHTKQKHCFISTTRVLTDDRLLCTVIISAIFIVQKWILSNAGSRQLSERESQSPQQRCWTTPSSRRPAARAITRVSKNKVVTRKRFAPHHECDCALYPVKLN